MAELFLLNEMAIQSVVERLTATVNDYVAAVNALADDGLQIAEFDPVDIHDYVPSIREVNSWPTLAVAESATHFEDDTGWGATGVHTLTAVVMHMAPDQATLAHSLRRYRIAVANCLMEGRSLGSDLHSPWSVTLAGTMPGPTLARESSPQEWMSLTGVVLHLKDEQ